MEDHGGQEDGDPNVEGKLKKVKVLNFNYTGVPVSIVPTPRPFPYLNKGWISESVQEGPRGLGIRTDKTLR